LALYAAGRRWFSEAAGVFASFLYLTTPWTYRISTIAYVEGGLSFFLFTALLAIWSGSDRSQTTDDEPSLASGHGAVLRGRVPFFLLGGVFSGAAMACKYPGVLSVVIPLFVFVIWYAVRTQDDGMTSGGAESHAGSAASAGSWKWLRLPLIFGVGVLVSIGPWLAKNFVETGNPVYPLLYTVFGGTDWDAELNAKWRNGHSPHSFHILGDDRESLLNMAIDVAARNDWVNPLLFALAPLTLLCSDIRRRTRGLWVYVAFLFLSWWILTHRIDRFWVPMTPIVALLAGIGAAWLAGLLDSDRQRVQSSASIWIRRGTLGLCLVTMTAVNLVLVTSRIGGFNNYLLDLGVAGRMAATLTAPEVVYLNEHLPPGAKVLAVGDAEMFEARFPVVYNTVFDRSIFEQWFGSPLAIRSADEKLLHDAEANRLKLRAQGITHVYVNWLEILRYRSPGNYGYTDFVKPRRLIELQQLGILGPAWRIPEAVMEVSRLNEGWQSELRAFAPELILRFGNTEVFTTYEVFPVVTPAEPET
jgi:hypothetical protein